MSSTPWGKWDPKDFEVEDFAMGTIRFEGGLTVTLETAWASHIENIGADILHRRFSWGGLTNRFKSTLDKKGRDGELHAETPHRVTK